jgi:hypothetical protein
MSSGLVNVGRMFGATLGVAIRGLFSERTLIKLITPRRLGGMRKALAIGAAAELLGAAIVLACCKAPRENTTIPIHP